jgi:sterol 3beta-glucosyltransferase
MAAVVHHGGAGTVAAALLAGKPVVCIPFMAD